MNTSSRKAAPAKTSEAKIGRRPAGRRASPPTLIAPQRILVPVDFSPGTDGVLKHACAVAEKHAAEIILLHVVELIHYVHDFGYGPVRRQRMNDDAAVRARTRLHALGQKHLAALRPWTASVRSGEVCEQIVLAAQEMKAGMILLPTRGLRSANQTGTESLAARIVRLSPCPVLAFKGPQPARRRKPRPRRKKFPAVAGKRAEDAVHVSRHPVPHLPGNRLKTWQGATS